MPTGVYERAKATCSIEGCERPHCARGYCSPHYLRSRRGYALDHPLRHVGDLAARFWAKVTGGDYTECWLWTGSTNEKGYGRIMIAKKPTPAHRVAYELMVAEIPTGLEIDHLCRTRACVNPWHLEPVTHAVNVARRTERVS